MKAVRAAEARVARAARTMEAAERATRLAVEDWEDAVRALRQAQAILVPCPRCLVAPAKPCHDRWERTKDRPHSERVTAGTRAAG